MKTNPVESEMKTHQNFGKGQHFSVANELSLFSLQTDDSNVHHRLFIDTRLRTLFEIGRSREVEELGVPSSLTFEDCGKNMTREREDEMPCLKRKRENGWNKEKRYRLASSPLHGRVS